MSLSKNLNLLEHRPSLLIVLSGPSGVGKDTLLEQFIASCENIFRSVTFATREPRPGERPGVDYHFVSMDEFRQMAERGDFLEYAQVHGQLYGSSLAQVQEMRQMNKDTVLKIDVQGGLMVKQKIPEAVMIFIAPPSIEELERRLRSRYTESEESITKRLLDARKEIDEIPKYDYLVVNDEVDAAVRVLHAIIVAERARIHVE